MRLSSGQIKSLCDVGARFFATAGASSIRFRP